MKTIGFPLNVLSVLGAASRNGSFLSAWRGELHKAKKRKPSVMQEYFADCGNKGVLLDLPW